MYREKIGFYKSSKPGLVFLKSSGKMSASKLPGPL